jgi:hypothetical protein
MQLLFEWNRRARAKTRIHPFLMGCRVKAPATTAVQREAVVVAVLHLCTTQIGKRKM